MTGESERNPMSIELIEAEFRALAGQLPDTVQYPPPSFTFMRGEYVAYESRTALTVRFPVLTEYLNPVGVMQGGFLAAAIDNTMGPLSYLAARRMCSTLDLHVQYLRAVAAGQTVTVSARVTSQGSQAMTLEADAWDERGKLLARAISTMIIVRRPIPGRDGETVTGGTHGP
jgi:uncharacterized protein (TIGR00369 family)